MNHKATGAGRHFRWSKRTTEGSMVYRLFRRDHTGRWHAKKLIFITSMPRCEIAFILRCASHELREVVDAKQLREWGYI